MDFQHDVLGRDLELRYFRDVDGREVDFVLCERGKAKLLLECKWGDNSITRGLLVYEGALPPLMPGRSRPPGRRTTSLPIVSGWLRR